MSPHPFLAAICMTLGVSTPQDEATSWFDEPQRNVGIFVFDDVQIIDFTGPYEVFLNANAGGWHAYRVFTVAKSTETITTVGGMKVIPSHAFDAHPDIDILVVPGGWGVWAQRADERALSWIQKTAEEAEIVFSICTGSFLLSRAGLLDGQSATTNSGAVARLQEESPTCRVLGGQRVVDSGKIVTSAGLSAGIDGSLHVVERTIGTAWAQIVSLGLEYDWRPESGYSAWKMAGRLVPPPVVYPSMGLPGTWTPIRYAGSTDHWESTATVESGQSDDEIHRAIASLLVERLRWTQQDAVTPGSGVASTWRFNDPQDKPWAADFHVTPTQVGSPTRTVRLAIRRVHND